MNCLLIFDAVNNDSSTCPGINTGNSHSSVVLHASAPTDAFSPLGRDMPVQDMLSLCVYIYVKRDAFSNPEWPTSEQTLQNAMRSSTRTGLPTRKHHIDVVCYLSGLGHFASKGNECAYNIISLQPSNG